MQAPDLEPEWRAAGVLPYAVLDGAVLVCLGKEYSLASSTTRLLVRQSDAGAQLQSDAGVGSPEEPPPSQRLEPQYRSWWSDFGGGREAGDATAVHTAAREWAEETIGMFGNGGDLAARVASSTENMRAQLEAAAAAAAAAAAPGSHAPSPGPTFAVVGDSYTMYACAVPHVDTLLLQLARDENDAAVSDAAADAQEPLEPGEVAEEDLRAASLRRRCGEKRDFAWVSLESLLAAVAAGRTWLRDVDDHQTITLLPRLGFALQASGPALLQAVSAALLPAVGSPGDAANSTPVGGGGMTVLRVPSRRTVGGCSLYLSVRRRTRASLRGGDFTATEQAAATGRGAAGPGISDAAEALQEAVEVLPRFGGVRRAVLHRYPPPSPPAAAAAAVAGQGGDAAWSGCYYERIGEGVYERDRNDPFALVTFTSAGAAAEAQRWLNSREHPQREQHSESSGAGRAPQLPLSASAEVVAEFAFFEPKKRRRSSAEGEQQQGGASGGGGWDEAAATKVRKNWGGKGQGKAKRGGGFRKRSLGVRPSSNAFEEGRLARHAAAAAAAADATAAGAQGA